MEENKEPAFYQSWIARNIIALLITLVILGATVYAAVEAMRTSKEPRSGLELVAQTLLPLWGTWIGTILAFYFSRENFEAATQSYQNIIRSMKPEEKIASISVKEAMLPLEKIVYLEYEESLQRTINDILADEKFKDYNRYAIFNKDKSLKHMIHRTTFFRFLAEISLGLTQVSRGSVELTLKDMEEKATDAVKALMYKGFTFVPESATLLDAKKAMDAIPECQDVFVTHSGKPTEPVLGLITNNRLMEFAKV
jgi:hypothetical protein